MMKARVKKIQRPAEAVRVLEIETDSKLDYQAGQYLKMAVADFDGQFYSIASAPDQDNFIEIHTKRGAGPVSQYITDMLCEGEEITIEGVYGDMVLQQTHERPILFVAGGLGITPIKAMIEEAARHDFYNQAAHLFWGAVSEEELYMNDYFEEMEHQYIPFSSHGYVGGAIAEEVVQTYKDLSYFDIYIAGKAEMLNATLDLFKQYGARDDRLFYDKAVVNRVAEPSQQQKQTV